MQGERIFMTGATSGLGKVAALELANKGADLIIASRNKSKENILIELLKEKYPKSKGSLTFVNCDLSDLKTVKEACKHVVQEGKNLDLIINNAGIMNFQEKKSKDGIEETFQVNVLAPALITHLLSPLLKDSNEAKIINTASALHKGNIDFDNIEHKGKFKSFKTYSQSKLGIILLTRFWANILSSQNIGVYSQHPGLVNTELGRSAGWFSKAFFSLIGKSPEKGAATLLYLAQASNAELENGDYYVDNKVNHTTPESYDLKSAKKLSQVCKTYLSKYLEKSSPIFDIN